MNKITPDKIFDNFPCTIVATATALIETKDLTPRKALKQVVDKVIEDDYHRNGYLSLQNTNKLVRSLLKIKRSGYRYFKRDERLELKAWQIFYPEGKYIVMVYGHCIFVDKDNYYSFFDNEDDPVVAYWQIEE